MRRSLEIVIYRLITLGGERSPTPVEASPLREGQRKMGDFGDDDEMAAVVMAVGLRYRTMREYPLVRYGETAGGGTAPEAAAAYCDGATGR